MSLNDVLPAEIIRAIAQLDGNRLTEIRLRSGQPLCIDYNGQMRFLGESGVTSVDKAIYVSQSTVNEMFVRACKNSVYAYDDQIVEGYISLGEGIRMGVAGELVKSKDNMALRKVFSLCIRLPHNVHGCSSVVWNELKKGGSMLVIAPCGCGKTTFLKDIASFLGKSGLNVTVIDERGELCVHSKEYFTGCDIVSNCPKKYVFENVIRSLSPDVVITDELFCEDMEYVRLCILSGTRVVASVHGESVKDAREKLGKPSELFDLFVTIGRDKKVSEVVRSRRE